MAHYHLNKLTIHLHNTYKYSIIKPHYIVFLEKLFKEVDFELLFLSSIIKSSILTIFLGTGLVITSSSLRLFGKNTFIFICSLLSIKI